MQVKNRPRFAGTMRAYTQKYHAHHNINQHRRELDRTLLPSPAAYYSQQFPNLKIKSEYVQVCCCFHDDKNPSLSISMISGHFRCFSCHAKGHDIIAFHMLRYKCSFVEAVTALGGWRNV